MGVERGLRVIKHCDVLVLHQAQRVARFFQRLTTTVSPCVDGLRSGDSNEIGGTATSCSASVGHDPMHDKQPTQFCSTTMTGRFA